MLGGRATQRKRQSAQHEAARRLFCVMSRHVTQCHAMSRHVAPMSRHVMPCHAVSRRITPCHAVSRPCHAVSHSCHAVSRICHAMSRPCHDMSHTFQDIPREYSDTFSKHKTQHLRRGDAARPQRCTAARAAAFMPPPVWSVRHRCGTADVRVCCSAFFPTSERLERSRSQVLCDSGGKQKTRSNDHHHVRIEPLRLCVAVGLIVWFAAGAHDQSECHTAKACCLCCVLESMYDLAVVD